MVTKRQRASNRRNAQNSTGPKTRAGKKASSQNARSHGLTKPPAPEEVQRWVRIITSDAMATLHTLSDDRVGQATRALATAQAHLDRAEAAERTCAGEVFRYGKTAGERDPLRLALAGFDDPAVLASMYDKRHDELKEGIYILLQANRNRPEILARRLIRIQGYVRKARSRKRRALTEWLRAHAAETGKTKPAATSS